ncbi:O-antigen polysaccharide polymerase Wzy [Candidatus Uabimicrobium amorphum]|uniref:Oligosaccharide repeat unit polymerase n=1 Tax=Uabimicrobium amorphum TaxID=2596890 RepID=A0A5S9IP92_UABAM|nr:O-antigen polysaccharide polymerase Wzy [Candidatus Uabimicrobium amorphum]BBM84175.1 hypothetical protein UABAM_02531 [Candidatus Uabimicrobium amorphum]
MNRQNFLPLLTISFFMPLLFTMMVYFYSPMFSSLEVATVCVILVFAISVAYNYSLLKIPLLSYPQVYLAVTFLFTSGCLFIFLCGSEQAFDKFKWFSEEFLIKSIEAVIIAILSFQFGLHLSFCRAKKEKRLTEQQRDHANPIFFIASSLVLFSFFILFFVYPSFLFRTFQHGYMDYVIYQQENDVRIPTTLLHWLVPLSSTMMALSFRTSFQKKIAYLVGLTLCIIFLLTGDRGGCFSFLLSFLIAMRINLNSLQVITLALAILFVIPLLFEFRGLNEIQTTRPIEKALQETGSSLQVLMGTMMIIPGSESHTGGKSYIMAIESIVPNLGAWKLRDEETMSKWIHSHMNPLGSGLGYLKIAEAYAQFGLWGVYFVFVLFGMLIGNWYIDALHQRDYIYSSVWKCYGFYIMLIWIRNHAVVSIRPIVWSYLLLLIIKVCVDLFWKRRADV